MVEPQKDVIESPAFARPVLKMLPGLRGSESRPDIGAQGVAAFDEAVKAYEAERDIDAARGFMRAAELFVKEDASLAKAASISYDNAAWAFIAASRADFTAREDGAAALEKARAADPANAEQLAKLAAKVRGK
jgi:hypothetical protein